MLSNGGLRLSGFSGMSGFGATGAPGANAPGANSPGANTSGEKKPDPTQGLIDNLGKAAGSLIDSLFTDKETADLVKKAGSLASYAAQLGIDVYNKSDKELAAAIQKQKELEAKKKGSGWNAYAPSQSNAILYLVGGAVLAWLLLRK